NAAWACSSSRPWRAPRACAGSASSIAASTSSRIAGLRIVGLQRELAGMLAAGAAGPAAGQGDVATAEHRGLAAIRQGDARGDAAARAGALAEGGDEIVPLSVLQPRLGFQRVVQRRQVAHVAVGHVD